MRTQPNPANVAAAASAVADPVSDPVSIDTAPSEEQIAELAYKYWEARGCPYGSPEEDWFRAEHELSNQLVAAATA